MKKSKQSLLICIAACSLLLGGCGEGLHDLTLEEENLVVHYAAYAVAKHNIQQKDGMSGVAIPEESIESEEVPVDTEMSDTQMPEGGSDGTDVGQPVESSAVSLAEAMGHGNDLFITYGGATVADNYVEGSVYSMDASAGNLFYIMKFVIVNPTQADVTLDNLTKNPTFLLTSGDLSVTSEVTFFMADLSTYMGTLAPGQTVEAVLLFEVPEDSAESIIEPTLQMIIDNQTKNIKL